MKRRHFITQTTLAATSGFVTLAGHGWAWRAKAQNGPTAALAANSPRLIVVFLRGGTDGLNVVVPYQEARYYEARPSIAIAKPGSQGAPDKSAPDKSAIDLDGQFGLHPALQPLMSEWQAGNLAFVHACGSPSETRSHFQAQDYIETGMPDAVANDGWLNRLLAEMRNENPTQAINVGEKMSLILTGSETVASIAANGAADRPLPIDRPQIQAAFDQLYAGKSKLAKAYQEGRRAREIVLREISQEMMQASRGALPPERFENSAQSVARLMTSDAATQIAFMELGNWDTHVNQLGLMQRNLGLLATGLKTLVKELGAVYNNTTIVVISEFGRTVAENGNGGTDHGRGNVVWLLGGGIQGKKVYGKWPGLTASTEYELRDLAITTDFRDVLISLLSQQFGFGSDAIARIFPHYQAQTTLPLV